MSNVTRALDALVTELTRRGSPLARFLLPGLPEREVRSRLSAAGTRAHSDVVALYAWHDGLDRFRVPTSSQGIVSLVPSHMEFNPLDESLGTFALLVESAEKEAATPHRLPDGLWGTSDPDEIWSRSWFPIFKGGGSEWVFVNGQEGEEGSVWAHPLQDSPTRLFDNLADAADAVCMALIDGRLVLDSKGVFTADSRRSAGIAI